MHISFDDGICKNESLEFVIEDVKERSDGAFVPNEGAPLESDIVEIAEGPHQPIDTQGVFELAILDMKVKLNRRGLGNI